MFATPQPPHSSSTEQELQLRSLSGKHRLSKLIDFATRELAAGYAITDLTIIERFHLKLCVIECARNIDSQMDALDRGEIRRQTVPDPLHESIWMWLNRLYGVDSGVLRAEFNRMGGSISWELAQWVNIQRDRAHRP
jgi:hypothetical protein